MRSRQQSVEKLDTQDGHGGVKEEEEDALCPICQDEMHDTAEKLLSCAHCHNHLHHHCMTMWMETPSSENVFCPLCRAPWSSPALARAGDCAPLRSISSSSQYQHYAPSPYQAPALKPRMSFSNLHNINNNNSQHYSNLSLATSSGYSTISRTSDTIHMIEQGGCPEDIPLPKAEPIPQQHWSLAQHWIAGYGRDLVACLLSRDWVNREIGLRRLAREVVKVLEAANLSGGAEYSERTERAWKCCAEMLATMIEDKVYKVYLAAVRATRALLHFLSCRDEAQLQQIRSQLRPIVQSILVKCADGESKIIFDELIFLLQSQIFLGSLKYFSYLIGNRRISELSTETLVQMCRGQEGDFCLGRHAVCSAQHGLGGLDFMVPVLLEERDLQSVSWQWIMGRLVLLERIIKELPDDFTLDHKNAHANYARLMKVIDFTFLNLGSSHVNVCKIARKVFILAARNTAADNKTFNQVWELLGALDPTLQMRMRKKLTAAIEELYLGETQSLAAASVSTSSSLDEKPSSPQEQDRRAFLEQFLRDCSNKHTEPSLSQPLINTVGSVRPRPGCWRPPLLRSTSHSPGRQLALSRSSSQSPSRALAKPQLKKPHCHSVLNIAQQQQGGPVKRPAIASKPKNISRLKSKYKMQEIAQDILPNFNLSFLSDSKHNAEHSQVSHYVSALRCKIVLNRNICRMIHGSRAACRRCGRRRGGPPSSPSPRRCRGSPRPPSRRRCRRSVKLRAARQGRAPVRCWAAPPPPPPPARRTSTTRSPSPSPWRCPGASTWRVLYPSSPASRVTNLTRTCSPILTEM